MVLEVSNKAEMSWWKDVPEESCTAPDRLEADMRTTPERRI